MWGTSRICIGTFIIFNIHKWPTKLLFIEKSLHFCWWYCYIFECQNQNQLSEIIEDILKNLNDWFVANKLTMNVEKSKFCIFRSQKNKNKPIPECFPFNNSTMKRISHIKYLGVFLDEHLLYTHHVNEVCKSLRKYFSVFYNIRRYLNKEHIKSIYYSMIY